MADAGAGPRLAPQALTFEAVAPRPYTLDGNGTIEPLVVRGVPFVIPIANALRASIAVPPEAFDLGLARLIPLSAAGPADVVVPLPNWPLSLAPQHVTAVSAITWIRPDRSTRSRKAAPPWPRRAARRPARRYAASVSSPASRPS